MFQILARSVWILNCMRSPWRWLKHSSYLCVNNLYRALKNNNVIMGFVTVTDKYCQKRHQVSCFSLGCHGYPNESDICNVLLQTYCLRNNWFSHNQHELDLCGQRGLFLPFSILKAKPDQGKRTRLFDVTFYTSRKGQLSKFWKRIIESQSKLENVVLWSS